uniref:Uncharacterized protein n=1 Tax=Sphaerodactylus townsendi TaxID=933632 RepID=A0ACB8FBT7_9SAUR
MGRDQVYDAFAWAPHGILLFIPLTASISLSLSSMGWQIRIRDPNQGGKDITEEIMSGARTSSTPTPPQAGSVPGAEANGETPHVAVIVRPGRSSQDRLSSSVNHVSYRQTSKSRHPRCLWAAEGEEKKEQQLRVEVGLPNQRLLSWRGASCDDSTRPLPGASAFSRGGPGGIWRAPWRAGCWRRNRGGIAWPSPTCVQPDFARGVTPLPSLRSCRYPAGYGVPRGSRKARRAQGAAESDISPDVRAQEEDENGEERWRVAHARITHARGGGAWSQREPGGRGASWEELKSRVPASQPKPSREHRDDHASSSIRAKEEAEVEGTLNKKDNLEADETSSEAENQPPVPAPEPEEPPPARPQEETDETWEEKEDKLDPEKVKQADQKYRYKEEQWKPLNPEEKKSYDREFLLGFQYIFASMQKPEGLPHISDVVLEKVNKMPLRPLDTVRLSNMNCGPDFTPSFANLGRPAQPNRGPPPGPGQRRSQQNLRMKEPRKIIATVSRNEDVKLNKAEKAWKPTSKRATEAEDPENIKTQDLFRRVRSILNKLTPQMFQQLMKQVTELSIDTEERLKGVIDLIFEKAISEPNFSVAYANMCRCLMGLKVPTTDKPTVMVNFRKVLLNRCQKEFEKDKDDDEIFEKKQKEMDDTAVPEEKARLKEELDDARDKARRRSLGNIKFIGELFKLKMLTEAIMHDCVMKLLKNHDEESLECLCRLLTTIGKDLDFEKAKVLLRRLSWEREQSPQSLSGHPGLSTEKPQIGYRW